MPALLIHIAYAQSYLIKRPELNELEVIRGSVFPDIRQMADLTRDQTHLFGVKFDGIEAETNSWQVGLMLHSYLDEIWSDYIAEFGEGAVDRDAELMWRAVKLAEEADYFESMHGREHIAGLFEGDALSAELEVVTDSRLVKHWNRYVVNKLRNAFDATQLRRGAVLGGNTGEDMDKLVGLIEQVRGDEVWRVRFEELHAKLGI